MSSPGDAIPLADAYWFQEGPGVRKWQFRTSGIKLLNVANIQKDGTLNLAKTERYLSASEVASKYAHFLVDAGDLVIASSGISFDEDGLLRTRGAFVSDNNLPLCLNTSTIRFKAVHGRSDLRFLRHWIDGREFRSQITRLVTGTAQQNFGPSHLKAIKITLPALSEQRRIAAILDKADALDAKRRAAIARLDTLAQSIFLDAFGDPAFNKMKWRRASLQSVCSSPEDIKCGPFGTQLKQEEFRDEGIPLWGIKHVNKRFELSTSEFLEPTTARRLRQYSIQPGDIVMTRKGTVGNCAVYPVSFPVGVMHSDLLRVRVKRSECDPVFLVHQLHHSRDVEKQLSLISGGAVMAGINVTRLKSLEILVPPVALQSEFAKRVAVVENLRTKHRAMLSEMTNLFGSLQQSVFTDAL